MPKIPEIFPFLLCALYLVRLSSSSSCSSFSNSHQQTPHTLDISDNITDANTLYPFPSLLQNSCQLYMIDPNSLQGSSCYGVPDYYIMLEFWRMNSSSVVDLDPDFNFVYVMLSRNSKLTVSVNQQASAPTFSPSIYGSSATTGVSFVDQIGYTNDRSYQRIFANASTAPSGTPWYILVANLNSNNNLPGYMLRASCVSAIDPPCPRPSPFEAECMASARGTCYSSSTSSFPYCDCAPGYGDYGCNANVDTLEPFVPAIVEIPPAGWHYFEFYIPTSYLDPNQNPEVLVEMERLGSGSNAGDPLLIVKPNNTGNPSLPQTSDMQAYGDWRDFMMFQSYQYIITRTPNTTRYYVGVYNSNHLRNAEPGQGATAQVNITLRYTLAATSNPVPFFCPRDCMGRGVCKDPKTMMLTPAPLPLLLHSNNPFWCLCNSGYGGTFCDGQLANVTINSYANGGSSGRTLSGSQWDYYVLTIDPANFNYEYDDIEIYWHNLDGSVPSSVFLTLSQSYYPEDSTAPVTSLSNPFFYNEGYVSPAPGLLSIPGSELTPGLTYVVAIYNSDLFDTRPFTYSVQFYVPEASYSWIKPYMSAVIGVSAALFVCMLLVLLRRFLTRRQMEQNLASQWWGAVQPDILPRRAGRGVPQEVINTFEVYELHLDDAEQQKARQLARAGAAAATVTRTGVPAPPRAPTVRRPSSTTDGSPRVSTSGAAAALAQFPTIPTPLPLDSQPGKVASGTGAVEEMPSTSTGSAAGTGTLDDDKGDDFTCTICLCDYEEGDRLRRLPCLHEFHQVCIDKWMVAHSTCPMCRIPLMPGVGRSEQSEGNAPPGMADGPEGMVTSAWVRRMLAGRSPTVLPLPGSQGAPPWPAAAAPRMQPDVEAPTSTREVEMGGLSQGGGAQIAAAPPGLLSTSISPGPVPPIATSGSLVIDMPPGVSGQTAAGSRSTSRSESRSSRMSSARLQSSTRQSRPSSSVRRPNSGQGSPRPLDMVRSATMNNASSPAPSSPRTEGGVLPEVA